MNTLARRMIGHGCVLFLIALVAGFGLVMSLIGGFEILPGLTLLFELPGDSSAWARTHSGGLLNGLMVFIFALMIHAMDIKGVLATRLFWMIVGAGYANTIFYWGGMLSETRALTFGDNVFGETSLIGVIGLLPAFIFAFITMIAVFMLMRHAFRTAGDEQE